jgi:membrane dipeptidase
MIRYFDAHCDTVMKVLEDDLDFLAGSEDTHLDFPRLLEVGSSLQLFAVFATASHFPGVDLAVYAEQAISTIRGWVASSDGRMRLALDAADVSASADADGVVYAMIGLEGADPLGDKAENLQQFHDLGVRNLIPAWQDNAFSGSAFGSKGPLLPEGKKLIEIAEALNIMVDVSHLSDTAFWQVIDITSRPLIASHSNCRVLCPSVRNLTDEMIRALADRGGVMGMNLAPYFLAPEFSAALEPYLTNMTELAAETDPVARRLKKAEALAEAMAGPLPGIDAVVRHVQHAIQVGGENCVGLGGDLDGISSLPSGITGVESYPLLAEALRDAGLTQRQVEKVCWRNFTRVFTDVL